MRVLRVTAPFASYARGETISDPALVEKYLASRRKFVVPVRVADPPAPAARASAKPQPTAASDAA